MSNGNGWEVFWGENLWDGFTDSLQDSSEPHWACTTHGKIIAKRRNLQNSYNWLRLLLAHFYWLWSEKIKKETFEWERICSRIYKKFQMEFLVLLGNFSILAAESIRNERTYEKTFTSTRVRELLEGEWWDDEKPLSFNLKIQHLLNRK